MPSSSTSNDAVRSPSTRPAASPRESRWKPRPHDHDADVKTYDFAYLTGIPDRTFASKTIVAITTLFAPLIAQPLLLRTLVLIFGGCCSNVYTLESILNLSSNTGTLITFFQFLFITIYTLPSQLTLSVTSPPDPPPLQPTQPVWLPRLKRRKVPLQKWLMFAAQFVMINVLNNAAFGYKISLPLHIILRSAGPVASMFVGWVWAGKKYSSRKVFSVLLLFAGVVLAALSDAGSKAPERPSDQTTSGKSASNTYNTPSANTTTTDTGASSALTEQAPGFALLTLALLLSAIMGVWSDGIYSRYGRTPEVANEQVFYGHLLSLPFFALQYTTIYSQYHTLMVASGAATRPTEGLPLKDLSGLPPMAKFMHMMAASRPPQKPLTWLERTLKRVTLQDAPKAVTYLLLNCLTQIACISGVHHLSTQTSALTVSIVLNVRKVISLLLSIYLFGNNLAMGVLVGAIVVFVGGGLYGMPEGKKEVQKQEKTEGEDGETKKDR